MGRNRFVQTGIVRLALSDVYQRRLDDFRTKGVRLPVKRGEEQADPVYRPATDKELAEAQVDLDSALADGAWLTVKSELTAGEAREANSKLYKTMYFGVLPEVEPTQVGFSKIMAYVTGWSLEDDKGPVPFDAAALSNVDAETYAEIDRAVDWHEDQVIAAREARKNATAGKTRSSETSAFAG